LSTAACFDWDIKVFNHSAAFLNGEFTANEEIYMEQAPHHSNGNSQDVIRLQRTIYGLKQSSWKWYEKLTASLGGTAVSCLFLGDTAKLSKLVVYLQPLAQTNDQSSLICLLYLSTLYSLR
jgi:hypothetical protein